MTPDTHRSPGRRPGPGAKGRLCRRASCLAAAALTLVGCVTAVDLERTGWHGPRSASLADTGSRTASGTGSGTAADHGSPARPGHSASRSPAFTAETTARTTARTVDTAADAPARGTATDAAADTSSAGSPAASVPLATPAASSPSKTLHDQLDRLAATTDADFSVGVLDPDTGNALGYGGGAFDTASIVKVDILATLLLQAQDAGRQLTAQERGHATKMIEQSDNDAATALWNDIGGAKALDAGSKRLGLTSTHAGTGGEWGLTQTTAADQVRLLHRVFPSSGGTSPLSARSRQYVQDLMGRVTAAQRWGVSAASDQPGTTRLKNGWLQRSTTGRWDVNSIGRVAYGGRSYLVAVVSDDNASFTDGVSLVEHAARSAVHAAALNASRSA